MANSLLDFVISLVRDPDAAARYAANPDKAIADAHLMNVTSADVSNLIPMVSDSLSMAAPNPSATPVHVPDPGNVWASGAATAALDAFTPHSPTAVPQHAPIGGVINSPVVHGVDEVYPGRQPVEIGHHEPSVLVTGGDVAEAALDHGGFPTHDAGIWDHSVIHPDAHQHEAQPDHHGFGLHG